jgi:DNA-binding transcriptional LysR family regulator
MLPSLRGLQALKCLHDRGTLTAAARDLGVSPSALSHRIADLQAQLGVTLVARSGRSLALTDDAEALLLSIGDAVERIEVAVQPLQRRHGELRVSTVGTLASLWLLPRLGSFRARHPDTGIAISTTRRTVDLENEEVDCAIRHGHGDWRPFQSSLIFQETLVPVVASSLPGTLQTLPSIRARTRLRDWEVWHENAEMQPGPARPGVVVDNRGQALEATLGGAGATMIDSAFVSALLAEGRLRQIGPVVTLPEAYYLVRGRRLRNHRLVNDFAVWLSQEVGSSCHTRVAAST